MDIVILGNGISGITAARHIRKLSDHRITVISKETDYFFSRTALMYMYMGHMRFEDTQPYEKGFWAKNRIKLIRGEVSMIDFGQKKLQFAENQHIDDTAFDPAPTEISYDRLVLALGSAPNKFGWPGQDLNGVQGLYSFQDLQSMEAHSKNLDRAVIVGGGLIGIEMAEMFHSRHIPVTLLVREQQYWNMVLPKEESAMVGEQIINAGIDLRLNTELKEIIDDGQGNACAVLTNTDERIDCHFVGLTAGVHPNVGWLKDLGLDIDRGILTNEYLQTNIPDVWAVGDCAQLRKPPAGRRAIEAVWYVGRMMGETAAYSICGQEIAYDPGIWFNSAKFMDMEYQVYGTVLAKPPENQQSIFWQSDDREKSIRLVFDAQSRAVIGFNLMGVRLRHEVCEKWIGAGTPLKDVLEQLALASFDPEFTRHFHSQVVDIYNQRFGDHAIANKRRRFNQVFSFLRN